MYDTSGNYSVCQHAVADEQLGRRLSWLREELAREEGRGRLFRSPDEERQMLLMRSPLPTEEAFRWFGTFLGLFPPAAIFCRMFGSMIFERGESGWLVLCLVMNIVCCLVGRALGATLGRHVDAFERRSWPVMLLASLALGLLWGLVTGAAGGAVVFIIGAAFGAAFAVPVGMLAFAVFTTLHRLLARGGMIEERHLWPLAFGTTCAIAALILGG